MIAEAATGTPGELTEAEKQEAKKKEKQNKKAEAEAKKKEAVGKLEEAHKADPRLRASHWAELIIKDIGAARTTSTKLVKDAHSSSMTDELKRLADKLEGTYHTLMGLGQSKTTISDDEVMPHLMEANRVLDEMRPLYTRASSTLASIKKSTKPPKSVKGD